eukprot:1137917-Pelagomonas_calceolata.AAC.4
MCIATTFSSQGQARMSPVQQDLAPKKGFECVRSKGKAVSHTGGEGGGCRIEGRGGTGAGGWRLAGAGDGETEPEGGGLGGLGMGGRPDKIGAAEGGVDGEGGGWKAIRVGWLGGDGGDENGFEGGAGGLELTEGLVAGEKGGLVEADLEAWVEKEEVEVGTTVVVRWAQAGVERLGEVAVEIVDW